VAPFFQVVFIVTQLPAACDFGKGFVEGEFPRWGQADLEGRARLGRCVVVPDWGAVRPRPTLDWRACAMLLTTGLRGKRFGLTAWLRFPLRMLSIQQLQRAMRGDLGDGARAQRAAGQRCFDGRLPIRLGLLRRQYNDAEQHQRRGPHKVHHRRQSRVVTG